MSCCILRGLSLSGLISEQNELRRLRLSGGNLLERHMAWVEQDKLEVSEKLFGFNYQEQKENTWPSRLYRQTIIRIQKM